MQTNHKARAAVLVSDEIDFQMKSLPTDRDVSERRTCPFISKIEQS